MAQRIKKFVGSFISNFKNGKCFTWEDFINGTREEEIFFHEWNYLSTFSGRMSVFQHIREIRNLLEAFQGTNPGGGWVQLYSPDALQMNQTPQNVQQNIQREHFFRFEEKNKFKDGPCPPLVHKFLSNSLLDELNHKQYFPRESLKDWTLLGLFVGTSLVAPEIPMAHFAVRCLSVVTTQFEFFLRTEMGIELAKPKIEACLPRGSEMEYELWKNQKTGQLLARPRA